MPLYGVAIMINIDSKQPFVARNRWLSNKFLKWNENKTVIFLVGPKTKGDSLLRNLKKNQANKPNKQKKPKTKQNLCVGFILNPELGFKRIDHKANKNIVLSPQKHCQSTKKVFLLLPQTSQVTALLISLPNKPHKQNTG